LDSRRQQSKKTKKHKTQKQLVGMTHAIKTLVHKHSLCIVYDASCYTWWNQIKHTCALGRGSFSQEELDAYFNGDEPVFKRIGAYFCNTCFLWKNTSKRQIITNLCQCTNPQQIKQQAELFEGMKVTRFVDGVETELPHAEVILLHPERYDVAVLKRPNTAPLEEVIKKQKVVKTEKGRQTTLNFTKLTPESKSELLPVPDHQPSTFKQIECALSDGKNVVVDVDGLRVASNIVADLVHKHSNMVVIHGCAKPEVSSSLRCYRYADAILNAYASQRDCSTEFVLTNSVAITWSKLDLVCIFGFDCLLDDQFVRFMKRLVSGGHLLLVFNIGNAYPRNPIYSFVPNLFTNGKPWTVMENTCVSDKIKSTQHDALWNYLLENNLVLENNQPHDASYSTELETLLRAIPKVDGWERVLGIVLPQAYECLKVTDRDFKSKERLKKNHVVTDQVLRQCNEIIEKRIFDAKDVIFVLLARCESITKTLFAALCKSLDCLALLVDFLTPMFQTARYHKFETTCARQGLSGRIDCFDHYGNIIELKFSKRTERISEHKLQALLYMYICQRSTAIIDNYRFGVQCHLKCSNLQAAFDAFHLFPSPRSNPLFVHFQALPQ
jgi:hypothetical protein